MKRRSLLFAAGATISAGWFYAGADLDYDTPDTLGAFEGDDLQAEFIEQFNEMRREHGLSEATEDERLAEMAQSHSDRMAKDSYMSHEDHDGVGIEDRYREAGLLESCRLPADGSNQEYRGTEVLARAVEGRTWHEYSDETFVVEDAESLVEFCLDLWLHSDDHRDIITLEAIETAAVGVAQNDDDIYVTANFC